MNELAKIFQKFLSRDLTYILGGSVLLLSIFCYFGKIEWLDKPTPYLLLGGAFGYVLGYVTQEVATLLGVVRTKAEVPAPRYVQCFYRRFERQSKKWGPSTRTDYKLAKQWLYDDRTPQRLRDDHERTESLKQFGTTLGPCFTLAGAVLFVARFRSDICVNDPEFLLTIALLTFFVGIVLIHLGWLKVTQQREYLLGQYEAFSKPPAVRTKRRLSGRYLR